MAWLTLQTLLALAYQLSPYQLADLPAWVRTVPWEINALASRPPAPAEQMLFLRTLLVERFRIVTRTETQERPVYILVRARPDGQMGAGLRPTPTDCAALMTARAAGSGLSAPPPPECAVAIGPGSYVRKGGPLAALADFVSGCLGQPVIDKTGLTGFFDIGLEFRPATAGGTPAPLSDQPDLVTALAEQLGITAESTRAPVPVTVFERLERPTPN
jgi:uncharacterized protein (TIGR03435 family)